MERGERRGEAYGHSRWHPVKGEWLAVTDPKGGNAAISPASKDEALTIAGKATWTDYLIEVDARPSKGPAGVCFLFTSPTDYWLWRFLPGASRQELVRVTDAGETIVDEARLALPDKGYTGVAIRVGSDFIRVSIPGADDLDALLPAGGAGKIGFWAGPGSKAEFDNVSVTFPPGYVAPAIPDTMAADAEMSQQFMNPAEGWFSVTDEAHRPQAVGMNWNKGEYFDPVDITFPMANVVAAAGRVTVTIEGDQTGTGGGYQLVLSTEENSPALDLTLSSRDQVLKQVQAQVADTGECAVRYGRRGSYIIAYIDDQLILSYREQPEGAEVANSDDAQGSTQP